MSARTSRDEEDEDALPLAEPDPCNRFAVTELTVFFRGLRICPRDALTYARRLIEEGYDDMQSLYEDVSEDELREIGMRPGHIKRVLRGLAATRQPTAHHAFGSRSPFHGGGNGAAPAAASVSRPVLTHSSTDLSSWSEDECLQWLSHFFAEDDFQTFRGLRIDGPTLKAITESDLDKLGIPDGLLRRTALAELDKLRPGRSRSPRQSNADMQVIQHLGTIAEDDTEAGEEKAPSSPPISTHYPVFETEEDDSVRQHVYIQTSKSTCLPIPPVIQTGGESLAHKMGLQLHVRISPKAAPNFEPDTDFLPSPRTLELAASLRAAHGRRHVTRASGSSALSDDNRSINRKTGPRKATRRCHSNQDGHPCASSGDGGPAQSPRSSASSESPDEETSVHLHEEEQSRRRGRHCRKVLTGLLKSSRCSTDTENDVEEEDVKIIVKQSERDSGFSGTEADIERELYFGNNNNGERRDSLALNPVPVIAHAVSGVSTPTHGRFRSSTDPAIQAATPTSETNSGSDRAKGANIDESGSESPFERLLSKAALSSEMKTLNQLKRPKSLMQFGPGGHLRLKLTPQSKKDNSFEFSQAGEFHAGGFQLGPHGISEIPECFRTTSPTSPLISTPRYTREATILLEELGRGACGTVHKGLYVPSLTIVAVKLVQVHDDERRRQMVRELKAFYSMSVAPLDGEDEMEEEDNDKSTMSVPAVAARGVSQVTSSNTEQNLRFNSELEQVLPSPDPPSVYLEGQGGQRRKRSRKRCPYIVNFYDAYTDPERGAVCIVLEYMNAGSLQDMINKGVKPSEEMIATVAYSVLQGLHEIHSRQIIHRDVKPGNILLMQDGRVKLSDFGIMRELIDTINARTFTGTMYYMSPERIRGEKYSFQSDIWSLGVSLITLATGKIPFPTDSGYWGMIGAIQDGPGPCLDDPSFSVELRSLVNDCVNIDQHQRPTAEQLLQHPFLTRALLTPDKKYNPPRLMPPPNMTPADERLIQYITDSVLEWQCSHLLDDEFYSSPSEPFRRHSIAYAGDRHTNLPDTTLQRPTLVRYHNKQIEKLAVQLIVDPLALQSCFDARWEQAEMELRNESYPSIPVPMQLHIQEVLSYFSDSADSAYATPRAQHTEVERRNIAQRDMKLGIQPPSDGPRGVPQLRSLHPLQMNVSNLDTGDLSNSSWQLPTPISMQSDHFDMRTSESLQELVHVLKRNSLDPISFIAQSPTKSARSTKSSGSPTPRHSPTNSSGRANTKVPRSFYRTSMAAEPGATPTSAGISSPRSVSPIATNLNSPAHGAPRSPRSPRSPKPNSLSPGCENKDKRRSSAVFTQKTPVTRSGSSQSPKDSSVRSTSTVSVSKVLVGIDQILSRKGSDSSILHCEGVNTDTETETERVVPSSSVYSRTKNGVRKPSTVNTGSTTNSISSPQSPKTVGTAAAATLKSPKSRSPTNDGVTSPTKPGNLVKVFSPARQLTNSYCTGTIVNVSNALPPAGNQSNAPTSLNIDVHGTAPTHQLNRSRTHALHLRNISSSSSSSNSIQLPSQSPASPARSHRHNRRKSRRNSLPSGRLPPEALLNLPGRVLPLQPVISFHDQGLRTQVPMRRHSGGGELFSPGASVGTGVKPRRSSSGTGETVSAGEGDVYSDDENINDMSLLPFTDVDHLPKSHPNGHHKSRSHKYPRTHEPGVNDPRPKSASNAMDFALIYEASRHTNAEAIDDINHAPRHLKASTPASSADTGSREKAGPLWQAKTKRP